MSNDWNAIIIPYDSVKRFASRKLVNSRGETIDIASGSVQLRSIICKHKSQVKTPAFLVSNIKTHFEIDPSSKASVEEYSPLEFLMLEANSNETKIYKFDNPKSPNNLNKLAIVKS